ncbi:MAG: PhzF family phenazine biosynthesis protein [Clostridiaceae bacterium]
MKIPIYQIDAFTDVQFKGNPAAICPLDSWISDELMQNIAMENNLSETAFFVKSGSGYELRWFTPKGEIDLCGHATLAASYVIFNYIDKDAETIDFSTKSGLLQISRTGKLINMVFPSREGIKIEAPDILVKALGKIPVEVYKSRDYMAVYEREEDIREMAPDMELLKKLDALGIIVTAKGKEADFVSRFFAPGSGVNEDPVTGSAHCTLVPYWKKVLGKDEFIALQLSERTGKLYCTYLGDRVKMSGEAAAYLEGFIYV